jgi:predicted outer membrane repeat protein
MKKILYMAIIILAVAADCLAATHYVVTNGTPGVTSADPYTSWTTAGTNIIDVVNAAMTNTTPRIVWVTNGTYYPTNVINVTNSLTLQSVNGRDVTILAGQGSLLTNRCANFSGTDAKTLDGFTITNFYVTGEKGVVAGYNFSMLNCRLVGNSNVCTTGIAGSGQGGGLFLDYFGTITNCIFKNNYCAQFGGGIYGSYTALLRIENCIFDGNWSDAAYADGGGACFFNECRGVTISNCVIINNRVKLNGAGLCFYGAGYSYTNRVLNCSIVGNVANSATIYTEASGGGINIGVSSANGRVLVDSCSIISNTAVASGGGVYGRNAIIRNCLIAQNQATKTNGGGVWLTNSTVESCTIMSNYSKGYGGGLYMNDTNCRGTNNIIYFNTSAIGANNFTNTAGNTGLHYSCVFPAVDGARNITNNPSLINLDGGNYRLNANSPCLNNGLNNTWMTTGADLDGAMRIRYGTVDMGAYERIYNGTIYTIP